MTATLGNQPEVYDRLIRRIFSGQVAPGTKLVERKLAEDLGVSRVPIRETLTRMVTQGVLVGGEKGQGVRVRQYTSQEVRQLYQFREMIEGGVGRAAAMSRTEDDLVRLEMICDQMESEVGRYGSRRWAELDHKFHETLAAASHQERFIRTMKALLTEAHYVFYLHPALHGRPQPSQDEAAARMRRVVQAHRELVTLIRRGDADASEQIAREHMRQSGDSATQALIAGDLD